MSKKSTLMVTKHIIAYVDILGYQNLVKTFDENNFLKTIEKAISYIKTKVTKLRENLNIQIEYKVFSDNIVFGVQILDTYVVKRVLNYFISFIGEIQFYLIKNHNIYLRGCLHVGNLYLAKNFLYGKGLIDSYNYENKLAIYPRIIVSNEFLEFVDNCTKYNPIGFLKSDDGMFFIDFLSVSKSHKMIIKSISMSIEVAKGDAGVQQKYFWLKNYLLMSNKSEVIN